MKQEKEKALEKLRNIKQIAIEDLKYNNFDNYKVKNVIHYNEKIELTNKESDQKEKFDLYVVITENSKPEKGEDPIFEIEYLEDKNGNIFTIADLIREYEGFESINDLVDKTKEQEEQNKTREPEDREHIKDDLNELEDEQKREKEEKDDRKKEEENQIKNLKLSNLKGEVNLDQQVNGETLRKILGLEEGYRSIAPVEASTVGVKSKAKYCFVAIKEDGTCKVLGEDILKQDRQEGTNPYDKDTKIDRDGYTSQESSISGFKIVNRPNLYLTVGFDERSSTRETTITDVSGRNSRTEEIGFELEKKGDSSWKDSDTRNALRTEQGIGKTDEMIEKQNSNPNDRIENIDADENNDTYVSIDPDAKIPGTDITWGQFANMCGYRGQEDGIEKAYKEFKEYEANNKDLENDDIINGIIEEKENEMPGPNRRR